MKLNKKPNYKKLINEASERKLMEAIEAFDKSTYGTEEYNEHLREIERINGILAKGKKTVDLSKYVNAQVAAALITTIGGLLGTAIILRYEQDGIITSKAMAIGTKMLGR